MTSEYKLFWTDEAINNLDDVLDYLLKNWNQREIDNFKRRLSRQIRLIQQNPKLFPISQYNRRLHRAVLSKQTTIFYEISGQTIYLVYIFNTRQDVQGIQYGDEPDTHGWVTVVE